jgi:hypothetical protein
MSNNIIALSSVLYGSIYIFGTSLKGINEIIIKNGKFSNAFGILNCSIMGISGYIIFLTSAKMINMLK